MSHFNRLETRSAQSRESSQLRDLRAILAGAKLRAPSLRAQMKGIDIGAIKKYSDLAAIPVVRGPDLLRAQTEHPPFGGYVATRTGLLKRILPSAIGFVPEGNSKDFWSAARAFHACGFSRGDVVVNFFAGRSDARALMVDSGCLELGCAVVPLDANDKGRAIEKLERLEPAMMCGEADRLAPLLEDMSARARLPASIKRVLTFQAAPHIPARRQFAGHGVVLRQILATGNAGVIAYETEAPDGSLIPGMIVNEGAILEIVRPGTGIPVPAGEIGEIVVTRIRTEYPLLRYGSGILSRFLSGPSPCGRTNFRIAGYLGSASGETAAADTASLEASRDLGDGGLW